MIMLAIDAEPITISGPLTFGSTCLIRIARRRLPERARGKDEVERADLDRLAADQARRAKPAGEARAPGAG